MRLQSAALLALLTVQVIFALHYLAAKMVVEAVPPRTWALVRVAAAAVILLAVERVRKPRPRVDRKDIARLALFLGLACAMPALSSSPAPHNKANHLKRRTRHLP